MSGPPERSPWDRRGDVRETLGHLSQALADHLEAHRRAMRWWTAIAVALIGVAASGGYAIVHDQLSQATYHRRTDSLVVVSLRHDSVDATLAAGLALTCNPLDTTPPPPYALRAMRVAPTCDSLFKLLRRRMDGLAP